MSAKDNLHYDKSVISEILKLITNGRDMRRGGKKYRVYTLEIQRWKTSTDFFTTKQLFTQKDCIINLEAYSP